MGATIGSLRIGLSAGTEQLKRDLSAAAGAVDGFAGKLEGGLGSALSGVAAHAATAVVGLLTLERAGEALVGAFARAITAARNLGEYVDATRRLFGGSSAAILNDAERLGDAFGVSKAQFIEAAGGLGGFLLEATKSEQMSARLGDTLAKVALDLSSLWHKPVEEAFDALQSGLAGQARPLRRFKIFLSEAAVEEEALRSGLVKTKAEITDETKVLARAAIIQRQAARAAGNLADTYDMAGNQFRAVGGRLENLAASFGQALEPATLAIVHAVNDALSGLGAALERNRGLVEAWATTGVWSLRQVGRAFELLGAVGRVEHRLFDAAIGTVQDLIEQTAALVAPLTDALGRAAGAIGAFWRPALAAVESFSARAVAAIGRVIDRLHLVPRAVAGAGVGAAAGGFLGAIAAQPVPEEALAKSREGLLKKVKELTDSLREESAAFGLSSAQAKVKKLELEGATAAELAAARAAAEELDSLERVKKAEEELAHQRKQLGESLRELEAKAALGPLDDEAAKVEELTRKLRDLGATPEEVQRARIAQAGIDLNEEIAHARKEAGEAARHIIEESRTPLQKFREELFKIKAYANEGRLSPDQAALAALKSAKEFAHEGGGAHPAALALGSKEARSAVLDFQSKGQRERDLVAVALATRDTATGVSKMVQVGNQILKALQPTTPTVRFGS